MRQFCVAEQSHVPPTSLSSPGEKSTITVILATYIIIYESLDRKFRYYVKVAH
jgi:hypothetical protein